MQIETALLVGMLFAGATYLILQRSFVKILFGFVILSNAANLLVLSMSGRRIRRMRVEREVAEAAESATAK